MVATNVLIVDECPVTRYGIKRLLEDLVGEGVFWEFDRADGLVDEVRRKAPDVVIMDVQSRFGLGIEMTQALAEAGLAKVIAFSAHDSWASVQKFLDVGGFGFISKRCSSAEFRQTFGSVVNGERTVAPTVRELASLVGYRGGASNPTGLSPREYEVAELVANGYTSKQIADKLSVSHKTIETHRYRIFKKLDIERSAQLVAKFFRMNPQ